MKRYKIRCHDCDPEIVQHDAGKWVRYTDVESLRAELAALVNLRAEADSAWDSATYNAERARKAEAELAACRELGSAMENALNTIVVMDRRLSLREREEIATMRRKWFAARKGEGEV